jgi:hypothetical protein
MTTEERADLIAHLSLTDMEFLTDPAFSNPRPRDVAAD